MKADMARLKKALAFPVGDTGRREFKGEDFKAFMACYGLPVIHGPARIGAVELSALSAFAMYPEKFGDKYLEEKGLFWACFTVPGMALFLILRAFWLWGAHCPREQGPDGAEARLRSLCAGLEGKGLQNYAEAFRKVSDRCEEAKAKAPKGGAQ